MGTDKRTHAKQLQRARDKREADRLAAKQQRSKVVIGAMVALLVLGLIGAGLAGALSGGGEVPPVADDPADTGAEEATDDATVDDGATDAEDDGTAAPDVDPCPPAEDAPEPTAEVYDEAPRIDLDPDATYTATVVTTCGEFVVELDAAGAPRTAENFVALAEDGYYTGTPFHRLQRDFVIQGGDPAGTGCGQADCLAFDEEAPTFPGYTIEDELGTAETFEASDEGPGAVIYPRGTVAMANSGPDTVGSQFFVVQADPGYPFAPAYTVLGTVTEGMDVVDAISAGEVEGDQAVDPTIVTEVRIETS